MFHVPVGLLYAFFGEISVQVFYPFFKIFIYSFTWLCRASAVAHGLSLSHAGPASVMHGLSSCGSWVTEHMGSVVAPWQVQF